MRPTLQAASRHRCAQRLPSPDINRNPPYAPFHDRQGKHLVVEGVEGLATWSSGGLVVEA